MFWKVDADSAHVLVPPPVIFLLFFLAGWGLDRMLGWSLPLARMVLLSVAMLLAGASGLLLIAALWRFLRARTNPEPWKTTSAIIDRGVYSYSRNPMYLGMALLHAGVAVALSAPGALLALVPVVIIIQTQVIAREERYLEAKFGDAYRAYRERVRRWL